jgi:hypothetical protein
MKLNIEDEGCPTRPDHERSEQDEDRIFKKFFGYIQEFAFDIDISNDVSMDYQSLGMQSNSQFTQWSRGQTLC